jgi:hypothetical protein
MNIINKIHGREKERALTEDLKNHPDPVWPSRDLEFDDVKFKNIINLQQSLIK